jgi:hypothetical protein
MKLEIKEYIPRRSCTDSWLKKLRAAGFKTDGYEDSLSDILTGKGFGLPVYCEDGFIFSVGKYTRIYLNYADSLAGEIFLLNKLGLI